MPGAELYCRGRGQSFGRLSGGPLHYYTPPPRSIDEHHSNVAKRRLAAGELSLGMGLRQARTVDIATIAKTCDFDWLFIDMEHNSMSVDTRRRFRWRRWRRHRAHLRVPGKEHFHATRLLDAGAQGIVVPHVDTAEEAERVVSYCKYPPVGTALSPGRSRSWVSRPCLRATPCGSSTRRRWWWSCWKRRRRSRTRAIAAVPGVDVLLIGFNDLCAEMACRGFCRRQGGAACAATVAACLKHGKYPGIGGVYDHKLMQKFIGMGARFILSGSDVAFMMAGGRERTTFLRSLQSK